MTNAPHRLLPTKTPLTSHQLSRLHTFEAAARLGSFAQAADELAITPSAVSHRINQLEAALGFRLFQRFHRRIALTLEGERVFWRLRASLDNINQEILDIKSQALSGVLTVYCRPSIAQCWLVPRLADFARRYPAISLNILTGNERVNFSGAGVDLAIYFDDQPPENLACVPLMAESILPVCSPDYARRFGLTGRPEKLAGAALLHDRQAWSDDSGSGEWHAWAAHFGMALDSAQPGMGFDRSDLAVIAAINHGGVAMGRQRLVSAWLASGELVAPFPGMAMPCAQRYYIATPSERRWPKIAAFSDWLRAVAENG